MHKLGLPYNAVHLTLQQPYINFFGRVRYIQQDQSPDVKPIAKNVPRYKIKLLNGLIFDPTRVEYPHNN